MTKYEFFSFWANIVTGIATVIVVGMAVDQFFDHTQTDLATVQTNTLQSQVQEMKSQFYLENTPVLTVTKFSSFQFQPNRPVFCQVEVANLGKLPSRILSSVGGVAWRKDYDLSAFRENIDTTKVETITDFVGANGGQPTTRSFNSKQSLPQVIFDAVGKKQVRFFYFGQVIYEHPQNQQKRRYFYVYELISINPVGLESLFQENVDLK